MPEQKFPRSYVLKSGKPYYRAECRMCLTERAADRRERNRQGHPQ
jgi:hypothetical protein